MDRETLKLKIDNYNRMSACLARAIQCSHCLLDGEGVPIEIKTFFTDGLNQAEHDFNEILTHQTKEKDMVETNDAKKKLETHLNEVGKLKCYFVNYAIENKISDKVFISTIMELLVEFLQPLSLEDGNELVGFIKQGFALLNKGG